MILPGHFGFPLTIKLCRSLTTTRSCWSAWICLRLTKKLSPTGINIQVKLREISIKFSSTATNSTPRAANISKPPASYSNTTKTWWIKRSNNFQGEKYPTSRSLRMIPLINLTKIKNQTKLRSFKKICLGCWKKQINLARTKGKLGRNLSMCRPNTMGQ